MDGIRQKKYPIFLRYVQRIGLFTNRFFFYFLAASLSYLKVNKYTMLCKKSSKVISKYS